MVDARDRGHCSSWGTVIRPSEAGLTRGDESAEGTVSRGVAGRGTQVYAPRYRDEGLRRIAQPGVRRRCDALLYQQLGWIGALRQNLRPRQLPALSLTCAFHRRNILRQ